MQCIILYLAGNFCTYNMFVIDILQIIWSHSHEAINLLLINGPRSFLFLQVHVPWGRGVVPPPSGYGTSTYSCKVEIGRYFRVTELRYQLKNWSNWVTGSDFTAVRGFS